MALTRRNQVLELVRQGSVGTVPITLPTELQTEWAALVAKYTAQTKAKKKLWREQAATNLVENLPATDPTGFDLRAIIQAALNADIAADTAVS